MRWSGFAMAALLPVTPALAADNNQGNPLVDALARCLTIRDDPQRLACTDVAARRLVDAAGARDVVVVDRSEVKRTRRSLFGLNLGSGDVFADRDAPAERIETLDTTIVRATRGGSRWTLALAEGGRWQTTEDWTGGDDPAPGMAVTIRRGAMGSYILKARGARAVRAQRIN